METTVSVKADRGARCLKQRGLVAGVLGLVVVSSVVGVDASGDVSAEWTAFARYKDVTIYDGHFRKYSKRFFGVGFDWQFFKSQAVAESNLREDVRSAAGAVGLMQIMPSTFEEIRSKNPAITGPIDQVRWNIAAGIWYNRQQFVAWEPVRSSYEKLKFMLGSYNAGRTSILRAQNVAVENGLDGTVWESIVMGLPEVTGERSSETLSYVDRVFNIREAMR